jgi:hypothetical protein
VLTVGDDLLAGVDRGEAVAKMTLVGVVLTKTEVLG